MYTYITLESRIDEEIIRILLSFKPSYHTSCAAISWRISWLKFCSEIIVLLSFLPIIPRKHLTCGRRESQFCKQTHNYGNSLLYLESPWKMNWNKYKHSLYWIGSLWNRHWICTHKLTDKLFSWHINGGVLNVKADV